MQTKEEILAHAPAATIIRQFSIRADDFLHFRQCRRDYERIVGYPLTNSQVLTLILAEHRKHHPTDPLECHR